jgi:6,7-dimethyl-8-ribityllumazine synthase
MSSSLAAARMGSSAAAAGARSPISVMRTSPIGVVSSSSSTISSSPAAAAAAAGQRRRCHPTAAAATPRRHETGARIRHGSLVAHPSTRVAVVVGRFNDLVTRLLLDGCLASLEAHGVDCASNVEVCWVPGAFELPVAAKAMARSGSFDAVVGIGAVVRGATTHYDAVVGGATSGLLGAGMDTGVPVVFGVLTCDTMEQALDRAGGKVGNKGGEAAATAVEMANLLRDLRADGKAAAAWGTTAASK